jgi:hypothetical protein
MTIAQVILVAYLTTMSLGLFVAFWAGSMVG